MTYSAFIVDDEPLARQRVRDLLAPHGDFSVACECASGEAALVAVARDAPDLVFLDVQMPGCDGFEVADAILGMFDADAAVPLIVFVTAYDRYALRAFDAAAVDYLLKPVGQARFDRTLERARRLLGVRGATRGEEAAHAVKRTLEQLEPRRFLTQRFAVRHRDAVVFVPASDIDWIDAAGNYMRLHVRGTTYMIRSTMAAFEARLDPARFLRIHRSAIVNLERVVKMRPSDHGELTVQLADGVRLTTSRSYSARLREAIRVAGGRR